MDLYNYTDRLVSLKIPKCGINTILQPFTKNEKDGVLKNLTDAQIIALKPYAHDFKLTFGVPKVKAKVFTPLIIKKSVVSKILKPKHVVEVSKVEKVSDQPDGDGVKVDSEISKPKVTRQKRTKK